jgi:putative MATE family efflux protein
VRELPLHAVRMAGTGCLPRGNAQYLHIEGMALEHGRARSPRAPLSRSREATSPTAARAPLFACLGALRGPAGTQLNPARRGPSPLDESKPLWQSLLFFLIPLMLTSVLQSANGLLTSIYLGRMIGVNALATVSGFFPIFFLLIAFFIGIGSAASILVGQAYGAHDEERMYDIAGTTFTVAIALGLLLGVLGALFVDPLLHAVGTPANIFNDTKAYAGIMFYALPLQFVFLSYTTIVRGTGDSQSPFWALIAATAATLVVTPALIAGWFGLPKLGVPSAAVTSITGTCIGLVAMQLILTRKKNPLRLGPRVFAQLGIRLPTLIKLVQIGIPTGVQLIMVSLSEVAVLSFVNRFGSEATAAYGAVNQIVSYVQFPAISIGIAASIFGAQSIGARRFEKLRQVVRSAVILNYVLEGLIVLTVYLLANEVLSFFLTGDHTRALARRLLGITLWSYAIFGNASVLSGVMRSSGTVLWPTLLAIVSIWGVEVPVAYFLMQRLGLDGIWIAYPIAYSTNLALQSSFYFFVWKKLLLTIADRFPATPAMTSPPR